MRTRAIHCGAGRSSRLNLQIVCLALRPKPLRALSGRSGFLQLTLNFERTRGQFLILGLQEPIVEPAIMLNRAKAIGRHAELKAAVELFTEQSDILQIGQEDTLGFVIGVANIVAGKATFAGQFANARHDNSRLSQVKGSSVIVRGRNESGTVAIQAIAGKARG